jgi:hypothetical protein
MRPWRAAADADHLVVAREQASWEPLDEISGVGT